MATVKYDAKTGKLLKKGQTTTQDGRTLTQGQEYNDPISQINALGGAGGRGSGEYGSSDVYEKASSAGIPLSLASDYEASGFSADFARLNSMSPITAGTPVSSSVPNVPASSIVNTNLNRNNFFQDYPQKEETNFAEAIPLTIDQERLKLEEEGRKRDDDLLKDMMKDFERRETPAELDERLRKDKVLNKKNSK